MIEVMNSQFETMGFARMVLRYVQKQIMPSIFVRSNANLQTIMPLLSWILPWCEACRKLLAFLSIHAYAIFINKSDNEIKFIHRLINWIIRINIRFSKIMIHQMPMNFKFNLLHFGVYHNPIIILPHTSLQLPSFYVEDIILWSRVGFVFENMFHCKHWLICLKRIFQQFEFFRTCFYGGKWRMFFVGKE